MKNKFGKNIPRMAVLAAFFTNGILVATWVARIPAVQTHLNIGEGTLGLVLMGLSSGMLAALLLASGLIARMGSRKVVLLCALLSCAALPLLPLASHPILLFLNLFIFGGGISAMDVAMNEQAVLVERDAGKPLMSSFHAGYSIGGVAGALIGSALAGLSNISPFTHFLNISIFFAGLIFFAYKHLIPTAPAEQKKTSTFQLPQQAVWVLGAIAFSGAIGEGASADWSAVYLTQTLLSNPSTAALGYAAFSATMTFGRLIGDWITAKFRPITIIRTGGILASLGYLIVVLSDTPFVAILGFALTGLGLANLIPLLFSTAGNQPGISPGDGIAGVATIGYAGFLAGPPLIGFLAETFSLRVSLGIVALILATLIFSAQAVRKTK